MYLKRLNKQVLHIFLYSLQTGWVITVPSKEDFIKCYKHTRTYKLHYK